MNTLTNDRYLLASVLQKSIRRAQPQFAIPAAERLYALNPKYLTRRLGVVMLEDLGLAALPLAEEVLPRLAFSSTTREEVLEIVERMCVIGGKDSSSSKNVAPSSSLAFSFVAKDFRAFQEGQRHGLQIPFSGSRHLTRICATAFYHPTLKQVTSDTRDRLMADSVQAALDEPDVLLAHAKAVACDPRQLIAAMKAEGRHDLARIMEAGQKLGTEGLHVALVATRHEKLVELVETTLATDVVLRGYPSWTYDKHTAAGSRALKMFVRQIPELSRLTPETALWVAYRILFRLESGLLRRETLFTSNAHVEKWWIQTLEVEGADADEVRCWWLAIERSLSLMDECRRRVLGIPSDNPHFSEVKS